MLFLPLCLSIPKSTCFEIPVWSSLLKDLDSLSLLSLPLSTLLLLPSFRSVDIPLRVAVISLSRWLPSSSSLLSSNKLMLLISLTLSIPKLTFSIFVAFLPLIDCSSPFSTILLLPSSLLLSSLNKSITSGDGVSLTSLTSSLSINFSGSKEGRPLAVFSIENDVLFFVAVDLGFGCAPTATLFVPEGFFGAVSDDDDDDAVLFFLTTACFAAAAAAAADTT
mmetsp:Transcript_31565/g.32047  ORF Transcript_31565/g.32047 Transcript_31565/m.32047 type:complete len:222 (-) Transcript_31565:48-713(-)